MFLACTQKLHKIKKKKPKTNANTNKNQAWKNLKLIKTSKPALKLIKSKWIKKKQHKTK